MELLRPNTDKAIISPKIGNLPIQAVCKRKNVRHLENLKCILSETKMKLYATVKKTDVEWSLMCSNRNV